jgi:hypothetical protein
VSSTNPIPQIQLTPHPLFLVHHGGGSTPRHIPAPPFYTAPPKPSHKRSVSGFWTKSHPPPGALANAPHPCHLHVTNSHPPPPTITPRRRLTRHPRNRASNARFRLSGPNPAPHPARWRTHPTPAASMSPTHTNHLPPSPHPAVSRGTPETEPQTLGFWFLVQTPPPSLALANVQHPRCLHVTNTHPPHPTITPRRRFTRHPRNRATDAQFLSFWLNLRPLASRWRTRSPTAASISSTRTHPLLASPHTAVLHGVPETEL